MYYWLTHLTYVSHDDSIAPCTSNAFPIATRRPRSCFGRAIAKAARSRSARSPICRTGRPAGRAVALCLAMIAARVIDPASKLATARVLDGETASCSLGAVLELGAVDEQALYGALDWLIGQQERVETELARRHLKSGTLVLYDVTSTYFEGRTCELARFGYNRDGKAGKLQIVFGLLCTAEGCPVAVEVFAGNAADPSTLAS